MNKELPKFVHVMIQRCLDAGEYPFPDTWQFTQTEKRLVRKTCVMGLVANAHVQMTPTLCLVLSRFLFRGYQITIASHADNDLLIWVEVQRTQNGQSYKTKMSVSAEHIHGTAGTEALVSVIEQTVVKMKMQIYAEAYGGNYQPDTNGDIDMAKTGPLMDKMIENYKQTFPAIAVMEAKLVADIKKQMEENSGLNFTGLATCEKYNVVVAGKTSE